MSVKDAVVDRFLELCHERNIRINELANLSGVTPSTAYSMMDKRRRDISIVTIKKILRWSGNYSGRILFNKGI